MSKPVPHPGIVVGVDGSPASKVAVYWAARDAAMRNVALTLVHVISATAATWLDAPMPAAFAQFGTRTQDPPDYIGMPTN